MKIRRYTFSARLSILVLVIYGIAAAGCKKAKKEEAQPEPEPVVTTKSSRAELSADSMFLYAKEVYLWNDLLPTYEVFNPRQYVNSDEEAGLNNELFAITRYAKNSYEYNKSYPNETKYSYIFDTDDANPVSYTLPAKSSVDLEGNGYDFGFYVGLFGTEASYEVRVLAVYKGSPAEKAGIKRGDVFTSINGIQVTANYTSSVEDFINAALFDASAVTLKVLKNTGISSDVVLSRTSYKSNPIYRDSVYTSGAKKIGYLAFARFSTLTNAQPALDAAFNKFAVAGVTDLIVDFRYNGGGYVSTAQYLADLIAPSAINSRVMYKEYFNSTLQNGKASILKNQIFLVNEQPQYQNGKLLTYADLDYSANGNTYNFAKKGSLNNVQNIVFLVSGNTASASELVINSLKPYITGIQLIGEQTYGKPVGFFPITIDKYEVYFSMFESKNSEGQGEYYSGMEPNYTLKEISGANDNKYDFGDLSEKLLASAYSYLVNGTYTGVVKKSSVKLSSGSSISGTKMESFSPGREEFKGMIEDRKKTK
ncbi:S41 family peptidase [Arcticibacter tournemirensis]|uniref:PDZ domain-containing protein n=1 Tax=Arcticibacter tournemirensis TaxID=699437 RepID=A0A4Q0MDK6_9SPHI|nr:S41 family peptidase [Arcticibacter tournemirensis]RXF71009.1 PDZ domain-containing protein [Arcticibacter tournemirensis]